MGVPKMPASHTEHRIVRDRRSATLVSDLFRGCHGDARGVVCQAHIMAGLDPTVASAGNSPRQEQAFGAAGVPGGLATGQKTFVVHFVFKIYSAVKSLDVIKKFRSRYRQAELAAIVIFVRLERTAGLASAIRWLRKAHIAERFSVKKYTHKLSSFFSRWSIKFSPEYYEARERQGSGLPSKNQQRATNAG